MATIFRWAKEFDSGIDRCYCCAQNWRVQTSVVNRSKYLLTLCCAVLFLVYLQMPDGQIAQIQYEHDGTFLQEQQVRNQTKITGGQALCCCCFLEKENAKLFVCVWTVHSHVCLCWLFSHWFTYSQSLEWKHVYMWTKGFYKYPATCGASVCLLTTDGSNAEKIPLCLSSNL